MKITFCLCCGGQNDVHKKGCADYVKMLKAMFGNNMNLIFSASDNGLLPTPPWSNIDGGKTADSNHPWEAEARELRSQGWKWKDIADHLDKKGFKTIGGHKIEMSRILNRMWYANKKKKGGEK